MSSLDHFDPLGAWPWQMQASDAQYNNITGIELIQRLNSNPLDLAPKAVLLSREKASVFDIGRIPSSEAHLLRVSEGQGESDNCVYYNCGVMSRRHAKVTFSDTGSPYIMDTGSHHGVFIRRADREPFKLEPTLPYLIFDRDLVTFGRSVTKSGKIHEPITVEVVFMRKECTHHEPRPTSSNFSGRYGLSCIDIDEDDGEGERLHAGASKGPNLPSEPIVVGDSPSPPPTPQAPLLKDTSSTPADCIYVEDSPDPEGSVGNLSHEQQPVRDAQSEADEDLLQRVLAHQFIASLARPPSPADSSPSSPASTPVDTARPISFTEMLHATAPPECILGGTMDREDGDAADKNIGTIKDSVRKIEAEVLRLQRSRKRVRARIAKVAQQGELRMDRLEEGLDGFTRAMEVQAPNVSTEEFNSLQRQVAELEAAVHPFVEQLEAAERDGDGFRGDIKQLATSLDGANQDLADAMANLDRIMTEINSCRGKAEGELASLTESFKAARDKVLADMEKSVTDTSNSLKRKRSDSDLGEGTSSLRTIPLDAQPDRLPLVKRIRRDIAVAGAVSFIVWAGLSSLRLAD